MSLVLDSSVTLAWLYSDEVTEAIRRVFEAVTEHGAVVPALWRLEVANSLTLAARRGRIDGEFRGAALSDLAMLDITTDPTRIRTLGAKRCSSPTNVVLPSTTLPFWNSLCVAGFHLRRWTKSCAQPRPGAASSCWGRTERVGHTRAAPRSDPGRSHAGPRGPRRVERPAEDAYLEPLTGNGETAKLF